jgi:F-type H+-transporting ATPase subunit epsilon|tara:strand:- start:1324 stop:1557 length:234 start_codon:yes stop_codon:yes gene_type:complete
MKLQIVTPDKELFSGEVESVVLPGTDGLIGVLNNHAPMVTSLKEGKIKINVDKEEKFFDVNGGVVEVLKNNVIILAT